mgnify:FL=1|tara:strand:+ start:1395 stop:1856 length:462 start_codon:yes stop_codon:yes gene_type:complete
MSKVTVITSANFKTQMKTILKSTIEAKSSNVLEAAMVFVAAQANTHSNFAPFTYMIDTIGQVVKPKDLKMLNKKTLIAHALECGLEINKDTKALRRVKTSNMEVNPTFWTDLDVPADKTATEKFEAAVKSAASNEMTQEQMIAVVNAQFTEVK